MFLWSEWARGNSSSEHERLRRHEFLIGRFVSKYLGGGDGEAVFLNTVQCFEKSHPCILFKYKGKGRLQT